MLSMTENSIKNMMEPQKIQKQLKYAPFKRGIMRFEDYNYNMYNQYILIDNQKGAKLQQTGYNNVSKMDSGIRLTEH